MIPVAMIRASENGCFASDTRTRSMDGPGWHFFPFPSMPLAASLKLGKANHALTRLMTRFEAFVSSLLVAVERKKMPDLAESNKMSKKYFSAGFP